MMRFSLVILFGSPIFLNADTFYNQQRYLLEITDQPLATALERLAQVTQLQFIYADASIAVTPAVPLIGNFTIKQALDALLEGSNIRTAWVNKNTVRLYRYNSFGQKDVDQPLSSERLDEPILEEVMVTSQKRIENLQDVPIAVSVVSGNDLAMNGIRSLQQLTTAIPNLYVAESFLGDALFVRGIGSGQNNLGFEQAVGQVIDGVFYGRSRFSRVAFFDLERIEILKGPQGTLLGKNTTAGAINITTAKPTDDFEIEIYGSRIFDGNPGYSLQTVFSGPISETLKARLSLRYDEKDGFIDNPNTGLRAPTVDDQLGRLTLHWDRQGDVDALFQYQYSELSNSGGNNQYSQCAYLPSFSEPEENCRLDYRRYGDARRLNEIVEGKRTFLNSTMLTVNWQLDQHLLTSVSGYGSYSYRDLQDTDRTSSEILLADFTEKFSQYSQELRLTSVGDTRYQYMAGLHYLRRAQRTDYTVHFAGQSGSFSASRNTLTRESDDSYAFFGQLAAEINPYLDVTIGGRYTYEKKSAESIQLPTVIYTRQDLGSACNHPVEGVCYRHQVRQDFNEENFSPSLNLQWRANNESLLYLSLRRGFKAGGFDHNLVAEQVEAEETFQFDAEQVTAYELGFKATLLEGSAQLNMALFYSDFKKLQLSGLVNSTAAINQVTNAGSAVSQGVEVDFRWQSSTPFLLRASVAYLNSRYGKYDNAPCYTGQPVSINECNDLDGDGIGESQDLKGQPLQFVSEWKASTALSYYWKLNQGQKLDVNIELVYVDGFPLQADLDPGLYQKSYVKINGRLALVDSNERWELALVGRNLGNKITSHYGDDVPLQSGNLWRSVDSPRSIALQGVLRF